MNNDEPDFDQLPKHERELILKHDQRIREPVRTAVQEFEACERLIADLLKKDVTADQLRHAVQRYLAARATNDEIDPETERLVLTFIAKSIDPHTRTSVVTNKPKRRLMHALGTFVSVRFLYDRKDHAEAVGVVAEAYGLDPEHLRKFIANHDHSDDKYFRTPHLE